MDLKSGQLVDERYQIERKLGEGGFATVYLARQLRLDRPVALKVLKSVIENPVQQQLSLIHI